MPVVKQPHTAHGLEALKGSEERTDKGYKAAKDGDTARDDVGDDGHAKGTAKPGGPVGQGVGGEMLGASEEADEGILGWDLFPLVSLCLLDWYLRNGSY